MTKQFIKYFFGKMSKEDIKALKSISDEKKNVEQFIKRLFKKEK